MKENVCDFRQIGQNFKKGTYRKKNTKVKKKRKTVRSKNRRTDFITADSR